MEPTQTTVTNPMDPLHGISIPIEWTNLLIKFQQTDPSAMIAGGALRDLSLGRAPKDLDIFTIHTPDVENLGSSEMDYEGMQYVEAVVTFTTDLDIPINIIIHTPISNQAMLESFDFGLCQIGYNGKEIIKTPAYDWDLKYGVFTMRHTDRYSRSIKRYARWLDRYDWNISIPELNKDSI